MRASLRCDGAYAVCVRVPMKCTHHMDEVNLSASAQIWSAVAAPGTGRARALLMETPLRVPRPRTLESWTLWRIQGRLYPLGRCQITTSRPEARTPLSGPRPRTPARTQQARACARGRAARPTAQQGAAADSPDPVAGDVHRALKHATFERKSARGCPARS